MNLNLTFDTSTQLLRAAEAANLAVISCSADLDGLGRVRLYNVTSDDLFGVVDVHYYRINLTETVYPLPEDFRLHERA